MKLSRIEAFCVAPRWVFVRVESDSGAVGWGEASLEGHAEAVEGAFGALRERFIGADPFRIEEAWQIGVLAAAALALVLRRRPLEVLLGGAAAGLLVTTLT